MFYKLFCASHLILEFEILISEFSVWYLGSGVQVCTYWQQSSVNMTSLGACGYCKPAVFVLLHSSTLGPVAIRNQQCLC